MAQPKPLASLSSSLLARKGAARPAMRPHDLSGFGPAPASPVDDLGWNDMGPVVDAPDLAPDMAMPSVLIEREALEDGIARVRPPVSAPTAVKSVSIATASRINRETAKKAKGAKAAFTLRLDADRHLRLRLASAVTNVSCQQLVTQALDAFLQSVPEVDALVAKLPPSKSEAR